MLFNLTANQIEVLKNTDYNYILVYDNKLIVGLEVEEGKDEYIFRSEGSIINKITLNNSSQEYIIKA